MNISVRAVYEDGKLRPLQPLDLVEGQEIDLMILGEQERAVAVLGDLLVQVPYPEDDEADDAALMKEIEQAFQGQRPLSETIIEERREGP